MHQIVLGEELWGLKVAIKGRPLDEQGCIVLARRIIKAINMRYRDATTGVVLEPKVWHYPWAGNGGVGDTVCQPAYTICQPLFESFSFLLPGMVAMDTWAEHEGWYLVVESCRKFSHRRVLRYLQRLGYEVIDYATSYVRLKPKRRWRKWWRKWIWW